MIALEGFGMAAQETLPGMSAVAVARRPVTARGKAARTEQLAEAVIAERRVSRLHRCDRCGRIAGDQVCGWCGRKQVPGRA